MIASDLNAPYTSLGDTSNTGIEAILRKEIADLKIEHKAEMAELRAEHKQEVAEKDEVIMTLNRELGASEARLKLEAGINSREFPGLSQHVLGVPQDTEPREQPPSCGELNKPLHHTKPKPGKSQ